MLKRVLYISESLIPLSAAGAAKEMSDLLDQSRQHNRSAHITGALLWSDGHFAQAIEGESAALAQTFERISRDKRHHNIDVLQFDTIDHRAFPDWSMAFVERHAQTNMPASGQSDIPREAAELLTFLTSLVTETDR